jgi:O-antigen ligase
MKQNKKSFRLKTISISPLDWGVILLFLLPPIGIICMIGRGLYHLYRGFLCKKIVKFHPTSFFFLTLFLSSIGACLQQKEGLYFFTPVMVLGYFGLYLYVKEENETLHVHRLSRIIVLGGLYIATVGQFQLQKGYAYGENWWFGMLTGLMPIGFDEQERLFGSAYNPNFAAFLLLLAIACLLARMLHAIQGGSRKPLLILFLIVPLFPIALAIIQTGSRAGVAIMVLLFLLFVWKIRWQAGILLSIISIGLLVYTESFSTVIPRFDSLSQSLETREEIWKNSIHVWSKSPVFGVTPLGFRKAYAMFDSSGITHAHNIVLGFFSEYGVIGGVSFLLLVMTCLYKAAKIFALAAWHEKIVPVFFFSLPVLLFTGLLDHPLVSPQTALLAIILLGGWDRYTDSIPVSSASTTLSSSNDIQAD